MCMRQLTLQFLKAVPTCVVRQFSLSSYTRIWFGRLDRFIRIGRCSSCSQSSTHFFPRVNSIGHDGQPSLEGGDLEEWNVSVPDVVIVYGGVHPLGVILLNARLHVGDYLHRHPFLRFHVPTLRGERPLALSKTSFVPLLLCLKFPSFLPTSYFILFNLFYPIKELCQNWVFVKRREGLWELICGAAQFETVLTLVSKVGAVNCRTWVKSFIVYSLLSPI